MENHSGEVKELVLGKPYKDFMGCEKVPTFTVEPCVGGMVSGIQMKWRIRYGHDGKEKVLVVMNGVPFSIAGKNFFIEYSKTVQRGKRMKGYAIYST